MKSNEEILEEARALVAQEPHAPFEDPEPERLEPHEPRWARLERERAEGREARVWVQQPFRYQALYGLSRYALVAYIAPHPGRPDAWEPLHNLWEEPDEQELRRQKTEYDRHGDYALGGSFAGDWIPRGRVPYELIPDEDELTPIGRVTTLES